MSPNSIFNVKNTSFLPQCLATFSQQYHSVPVYQQYCRQLGVLPNRVTQIEEIPFLPISFFKTHAVIADAAKAECIFTSSGTTGQQTSKHYVRHIGLYEQSFNRTFNLFFGEPSQYAILCLLPSYLQRSGSSLVYMADKLIKSSQSTQSGFFLESKGALSQILLEREKAGKPSILLGVTYALLDFAAENPIALKHTLVMETGGMKGRREEMTRAEVHDQLKQAFGISQVYSEYGMTELLSQAYAKIGGLFECPPWMRVLVRPEDDPFALKTSGTGLLCIVDLANQYSCSFIETSDLGRLHANGSFEVLGRMDHSDIRGCSLLAL